MAYTWFPLKFTILSVEQVENLRRTKTKIYKIPYSTFTKLKIPQLLGARPGDVLRVEETYKRPSYRNRVFYIELTGAYKSFEPDTYSKMEAMNREAGIKPIIRGGMKIILPP